MKYNFRKIFSVYYLILAIVMMVTLPVVGFALDVEHRAKVTQALQEGKPRKADSLIIQFKIGTDAAVQNKIRNSIHTIHHQTVIQRHQRADRGGDVEVVTFNGPRKSYSNALSSRMSEDLDIQDTIDKLSTYTEVEFAEPNWIYTHQDLTGTSDDLFFTSGKMWGMYGEQTTPVNKFGSHAADAWAIYGKDCAGVYVGVVDTGIFINHKDLINNIWVNPYDPIDGVDNDGNGYVDDVNGWNFDTDNNKVYTDMNDFHGTHVAGTIAASGGNGIGVTGVCWNAKIISAKFMGAYGGATSDAVRAIDYLISLKKNYGINIVAINNSWGGGGYSKALYDAIERAQMANVLFVAAAGNGGNDLRGDNIDMAPFYPASYTNANVISVASLTSGGALSAFSNYGAGYVDLAAPGHGIYSTMPDSKGGSVYLTKSGTSMAAPHVTGAAALYAALHPGASFLQIKEAILAGTTPTASLKGKTFTGGRLDIRKALEH